MRLFFCLTCLLTSCFSIAQVSIVVKNMVLVIPGKTGGELMGKTGEPATVEGFYDIDTSQRTLTSTVVKRFEDFETTDNVDVDQFIIHFEDIDRNEMVENPVYDDETFKTPFYYVDYLTKELNPSVEHLACIHGSDSDQLKLAESSVWIRFYFLEKEEGISFIQTIQNLLN